MGNKNLFYKRKQVKFWRFLNSPLVIALISIGILFRIYAHYNMIDILNKTVFQLPYAYEYNFYRGATNIRGNRSREILEDVPIEININTEQRFWFSLTNENYKSLKDTTLTLVFPEGIEVKGWREEGWTEYMPNEWYSYDFDSNIHNGMTHHTKSLIVKSSKKGDYIINYCISGEGIQRKDRKFIIRIK